MPDTVRLVADAFCSEVLPLATRVLVFRLPVTPKEVAVAAVSVVVARVVVPKW